LCDLVNNRLCEIANLNNDETIVDKHTIKHVSFEDALKELIELKKANNK
jgi:predicted metallo-beta-lactamase superfamily hydrolase